MLTPGSRRHKKDTVLLRTCTKDTLRDLDLVRGFLLLRLVEHVNVPPRVERLVRNKETRRTSGLVHQARYLLVFLVTELDLLVIVHNVLGI